jgi:hypothetical protein
MRTKFKFKLFCDRQLASSYWYRALIWGPRPDFYYCLTFAVFMLHGALPDERTDLSFTCTISSGPCQNNHSCVEVPQKEFCDSKIWSWGPYFTVSFETLSTWRARSHIYIPQEQGGPDIALGTKTKTKLCGLSPWANYTDRATAACRRSDCQLVRIEGATWSAWRIPSAVFLGFLDRSRYFSINAACAGFLFVASYNRLMLFGEIVAVYCGNHTEHVAKLCGQNAEFWCVKTSNG